MVAGGGGGAYSDCCTSKFKGYSAEIGEDGGKGSYDSSDSNAGKDGASASDEYGGVGVLHKSGIDDSYGKDSIGWPGGASNPGNLPTGGKWNDLKTGMKGTWGFGGGGPRQTSAWGGGGGGGYSGGSSAKSQHGAGGGGSYLTGDMAISQVEMIINPTTSDTQDGFVNIQFTNTQGETMKMIRLAAAPDKCVDNTDGNFDNDNNIRVYNCQPTWKAQNWAYEDSRFHLAFNPKKCMDVKNHNTTNGTNVRLWDCLDHDEQRWIYDGLTRQFRSLLDLNKCLDAKLINDSNVKLWDCSTTTHQQWDLDGATTISNPTAVKNIVPVKDNYSNTRALQSADGAKLSSNIQLGQKSSTDGSIRFVFDGQQIKYGPSRDLCLGLADKSTATGTNIKLVGSATDHITKDWIYDGNTKQIRSVADLDKCIEVETTGSYQVGSNLKLMDCNGHSRQQFEIVDK